MNQRIIGFDLARAYAIFGMYIVNFNIVFGDFQDRSPMGQVLALFSGNSSSLFVMLAGMGVALLSKRAQGGPPAERLRLRRLLQRRAWVLLAFGLLLSLWWPADILHFYSAYMHLAALLLFRPRAYYLALAAASAALFHVLFLFFPYETGWDFEALRYTDFWTPVGFLRNTFYNGWNPVFPWMAYFAVGLYLGHLDWSKRRTQGCVFAWGAGFYLLIMLAQNLVPAEGANGDLAAFVHADYLPPFLPFLLSTLGFGLMLIAGFMRLSPFVAGRRLAQDLAKTGQMTLTHYISHLTLGLLLFAGLYGRHGLPDEAPVAPAGILLFASAYFVLSYGFSRFWSARFKQGPLEWLLRRLAG